MICVCLFSTKPLTAVNNKQYAQIQGLLGYLGIRTTLYIAESEYVMYCGYIDYESENIFKNFYTFSRSCKRPLIAFVSSKIKWLDNFQLLSNDLIFDDALLNHDYGKSSGMMKNVGDKIEKARSRPRIFVRGIGGWGNCMFQIAAAAAYAEIHNYDVVLDIDSLPLSWGTSNMFNKTQCHKNDQNEPVSYLKTLFSSDRLYRRQISDSEYNQAEPYGDSFYQLSENRRNNLRMHGFCQDLKYYGGNHNILPYIFVENNQITQYVSEKYQISSAANEFIICVGIRIGSDFLHMNKLTPVAYERAIKWAISGKDDTNITLVVLSDHPENCMSMLPNFRGRVVIINEDDVCQFYAAQLCTCFILSESTYHYWLAYIKYIRQPNNTKVYYFAQTDLTMRNLVPSEWIRVPYSNSLPLVELFDNSRTDKNHTGGHSYGPIYEALLASRRETAHHVLEIGIGPGGSILAWCDYFQNARIHALDIMKPDDVYSMLKHQPRISLYCEQDAYNKDFADSLPFDFDVIIDDVPHSLESMLQCIALYLPKLNRGGVMVIEDVEQLEWISDLRAAVPLNLQKCVFAHDLRHIQQRYDDILFIIDTGVF